MRADAPSLACYALEVRALVFLAATALVACTSSQPSPPTPLDRTITLSAYEDKLEGGWIGQMAAGEWGAKFEFNGAYDGTFVPLADVPPWQPAQIDDDFGPGADQTWSEVPFLETIARVGPLATWDDFGQAWANSTFPDADLYSANLTARQALRNGMSAPQSGHYTTQGINTENQTWQMESNWVGLLCPGQANAAIDIDWRAGHVIEFGDGVNGGVMIAAMQATAFFASTIDEIVEAGRQALPQGSLYRQMVDDIIAWHQANPDDIETVWQMVQSKWLPIREQHPGVFAPLDARLNGANVLLGLLYGDGDFASTVVATMRGGLDGDCTSNDVGSIIGTFLGKARIPSMFYAQLDPSRTFSNSGVSFTQVIADSVAAARSIVLARGGQVTPLANADEQWSFASGGDVVPPILEQWPVQANASAPSVAVPQIDVNGRTIHATGAATNATDYRWSFGDLERASGSDVTHTYANAGTYRVILWAVDALGNTAWSQTRVVVP